MHVSPAQFREAHPRLFFLDAAELDSLERHLRSRGVLAKGNGITSAARAGDGNMNCTLRVTTRAGSFIVKQSRPWVEKYPQFAAPWDRACREAEFYRLIASQPHVAALMPRLLDFDPEARVLVFEDLGTAGDYTGVYRGETLTAEEIEVMAAFLSELHRSFGTSSDAPALSNREMRELNHAHIFVIPLVRDNGLNLDAITSGLAEAARPLQSDPACRREVARLGREVYLAQGSCLLHGDFFPGSLLRTVAGPRVIDPEFGHFGHPEFDVSVFLAHLLLSDQPLECGTLWRHAYAAPPGFDDARMLQLAGVEIMRRLIGYAQLPLGFGLQRKRELLELSRNLILEPQLGLPAGS